MTKRLNLVISLGVIALIALMVGVGIPAIGKANKRKKGLNTLPPLHRPLGGELLETANPIAPAGKSLSEQEAFGAPQAPGVRGFSVLPGGGFQDSGNQTFGSKGFSSASQWPRQRQTIADRGQGAANQPMVQAPYGEQAAGTSGLLSPAEQNAATKTFIEGHWLGMETVDLTPALRRIYRIPVGVAGVLVDEITLEAAESGVLAGDLVTSMGGMPTRDLNEFLWATETVAAQKQAEVVVARLGTERRFTVVAKNTGTLGFAQMEAAQPIRPGSLSPHRKRRAACTDCHIIMASGGQLPVDAGDITPTVPPISANARPPHSYRGTCRSCHVIK
jgi:hypothetical protein